MKILHINDQAGVACILAKFQEKQGVKSKVIAIADINRTKELINTDNYLFHQ